jgi:hypothetical protein
MSNKRYVWIVLGVATLVVSALACNPPGATRPKPPLDTVTPYALATAQPQDAPTSAPPTDAPSESVPTDAPSAPTDTPNAPTETPTPPATSTSAPTRTPTPPVSEGPLDFEEPRWVQAWEPRAEGGVLVTVKVQIIGGAPPFMVYLDGGRHGESAAREYLLDFPSAGCGQIVHTITVESADGQSKTDDFWLGGDLLPWCD